MDDKNAIEAFYNQKQWPMALVQSKKFLYFIDHMPDAVFASNMDGDIIQVNQAACDLVGYTHEELLQLKIEDLVPTDKKEHIQYRKAFFKKPTSRILGKRDIDLHILHRDGHQIPMDATLFMIDTDEGPLATNIIRDISHRKAKEEQLKNKAWSDQLTGLANRHFLKNNYLSFVNTCKNASLHVGAILLDLDGFKPINDNYGHDIGDEVLKVVSKRLSTLKRSGDILARIGGDEFLLLVPIDEAASAGDICQRILGKLEQPIHVSAHLCHLSASIGVAVNDSDDTPLDVLLKEADKKMYAAKRHGKAQFQL